MGLDDLKKRTKQFALKIIAFVERLPKTRTACLIGGQLLRCGTSVGSNYRSACRARSLADFIAKMGIVEEESDESIYWMELLVESGQITLSSVADLLNEANEILSIMVSSIKTARARQQLQRQNSRKRSSTA